VLRLTRKFRAIVAVAAMLLVIACAGPAASPTSSAPSSPGATVAVSPTTAVPSATATASSTVSASPRARRTPTPIAPVKESDAVVRLEQTGDTGGPWVVAVVMVDGRFITRMDDTSVTERRLTASGVQRVRDEILGTGVFGQDQRFPLEPAPGQTPPAHGLSGVIFKAWTGARIVTVSTLLASSEESFYKPSPARTKLGRLSQQLLKPETWLAAASWSDPTPRPYASAVFRLLAVTTGPIPGDVRPELDSMDWPFTKSLPAIGEPATASSLEPKPRCVPLTRDDASVLRTEFARIGALFPGPATLDGSWSAQVFSTSLGLSINVFAEPLWPDQFSCASATFY